MFHFNSPAEKKSEGRRPATVQRTRIEDIAAVGEQLSTEDLQLVHGGMMCSGSPWGTLVISCGGFDACDC